MLSGGMDCSTLRRLPALLGAALCSAWLAGAAAAPLPVTPCPRFTPPAPVVEARLEAAGPLTIVALGSSSTEGAAASGPEAAYPPQLEARLRAALPGREVRVVNAGRSGETSVEMVARIGSDVLAHRPSLVLWQAGGNEALRDWDTASFARTMQEGLARFEAAGVPVVLVDNQRSARMVAARAERFDAVLAQLAAPRGIGLFSRAAWQAASPDPAALNAPDGVHHSDAGYACLAAAIAEAVLPAVRPDTTTVSALAR